MNSNEVFIHIHQGCFAGTGAIVRLPQCQWSKPDGYGKISQCITTTKHNKAKTVCIFLGIYCMYTSVMTLPVRYHRYLHEFGIIINWTTRNNHWGDLIKMQNHPFRKMHLKTNVGLSMIVNTAPSFDPCYYSMWNNLQFKVKWEHHCLRHFNTVYPVISIDWTDYISVDIYGNIHIKIVII